MRNLLDTSSVAQSLDGNRLKGSLHIPDANYREPRASAQVGQVMSAAAVARRHVVDPVALDRLVRGKIDLHFYGRRAPHKPLAEFKIGPGFLLRTNTISNVPVAFAAQCDASTATMALHVRDILGGCISLK